MNIKICDNCGNTINNNELFNTINGKDYCNKTENCKLEFEYLNNLKKIENYKSRIEEIETHKKDNKYLTMGYINYYNGLNRNISVIASEKEFTQVIIDYCNNKINELTKLNVEISML